MEHISGRINEAVRLRDGTSISITRLDEVLFCHPHLSAYAAEMVTQNGGDCLVITARPAQYAVDAEQIAVKLSNHDSIGNLIKQGRLKLTIREEDIGYFTTGTAKRFIADRRNQLRAADCTD
jgi:hypothetical protein